MIIPERKIGFVHVPKTGGVSITSALLSLEGLRLPGERVSELPWAVKHRYGLGAVAKHWSLGEMLSALPTEIHDWEFFCVVRHPLARFVSEFLWRQKSCGFTGTVDRLLDIASECKPLSDTTEQDRDLQVHFVPQSHLIQSTCATVQPKIFRYESISHVSDWLARRYRRSVLLPQFNRTSSLSIGDVLSMHQKRRVMDLYAEDIDRFSYSNLEL
ncbi:MAG: hypothetical protein Aurels2KO_48120 [Aureliella sp.]